MHKDRFVRSVHTAGKFMKAVRSALAVSRIHAEWRECIDPESDTGRAIEDRFTRAVQALEKEVVDWLNAVTRDR